MGEKNNKIRWSFILLILSMGLNTHLLMQDYFHTALPQNKLISEVTSDKSKVDIVKTKQSAPTKTDVAKGKDHLDVTSPEIEDFDPEVVQKEFEVVMHDFKVYLQDEVDLSDSTIDKIFELNSKKTQARYEVLDSKMEEFYKTHDANEPFYISYLDNLEVNRIEREYAVKLYELLGSDHYRQVFSFLNNYYKNYFQKTGRPAPPVLNEAF